MGVPLHVPDPESSSRVARRRRAWLVALVLSPASAVAAVDTGVSLELLARTAGGDRAATGLVVNDGGVLRSGDGVQIHLRARKRAYVYVIAYGSSQRAALVFPYSGKAEEARLGEGDTRVLPGGDRYLPLDDVEGRESLFMIVSETPVTDIDALLRRMEKQQDNLIAVADVVREAYPESTRLSFRHVGKAPLVGVDVAGLPRIGGTSARGFDLGGRQFASEATAAPEKETAVVGPRLGDISPSTSPRLDSPTREPATKTDTVTRAEPTAEVAAAAESTRARDGEAGVVPPAEDAQARARDADTGEVSDARRRARERAGVDSTWFDSIVSSLPPGPSEGKDGAHRSGSGLGVLSAVGDRIRTLERQSPHMERRLEQLERPMPDGPEEDTPATSDEPEHSSRLGVDERVSIGPSVLPASTQ